MPKELLDEKVIEYAVDLISTELLTNSNCKSKYFEYNNKRGCVHIYKNGSKKVELSICYDIDEKTNKFEYLFEGVFRKKINLILEKY